MEVHIRKRTWRYLNINRSNLRWTRPTGFKPVPLYKYNIFLLYWTTGLRGRSFDGTKSGGGNTPQPPWVRRLCLDGRENLIVVELLQNLNNDNHLKVFPYEWNNKNVVECQTMNNGKISSVSEVFLKHFINAINSLK